MDTCISMNARFARIARLIVSNISERERKSEGGEGEGKEKKRDIVRGSLPTIRITKDGHDERQRRAEEGAGREKSLIINTEVGRENSTMFRERTRTMTRRRGRLRRSRPNGHGLAPGKTLLAKRRESVQRLSLGFKKLLITWIFSSVPPR